ncbi:3-oxo-tetronate kinase [Cognatishimia sp. WU-CL00825]|uniref:3-oxo-tetronate kinase n=1 Tax=Cognatishimia sp. WU-CL00825 TaxID=3127658 RepID=UPI00336577BC
MTYFGAIADDLTGATDLAGLMARAGVAVSLRIGVPEDLPEHGSAIEVIALKSRTEPVQSALAETKAALRWLQAAGTQRYFWKYCSTFDSTAEGNIGPVAEMLMAEIGADQTIYCPAFPENGRSVFMGNLFVGQQPLSESPMQHHPLTPMTDSNLMRLLEPQVTRKVGLLDRLQVAQGPEVVTEGLAALEAQGVAHVIVDAVANNDLYSIAEACRHMPLLTGGSALAMALPHLYMGDGSLETSDTRRQFPATCARGVVLSGSCSAMTNRQVAEYLAQGRPCYKVDPLELAQNGPSEILDWLSRQDLDQMPLVYATARPDSVKAAQELLGVAEAGAMVEQVLATCATVARDLGARRIVVAGGETSGAVTKALGADQLDVGPEIAPGVPWCFCKSDGHQMALTLKSGNFGAAGFFSDAIKKLDSQ